MAQLRHRPLFPAHVTRVTNSEFRKDNATAMDGQRTALNAASFLAYLSRCLQHAARYSKVGLCNACPEQQAVLAPPV